MDSYKGDPFSSNHRVICKPCHRFVEYLKNNSDSKEFFFCPQCAYSLPVKSVYQWRPFEDKFFSMIAFLHD
jgi:hypothetical protein